MKKLRIGIVGMGFIADWHLQGFAPLPSAEIVGLCQDFHGDDAQIETKRTQLRDKCAALGLRAYASFAEMAADPEIDALIIGSINPYHHAQIVAGLNAGKHLLVEKPVVTDLGQIAEIQRLARERNLVVFPGHNFAYRGAVRAAKALIQDGKLGRIVASSFVSSHTIGDGHANGWRSKKALSRGGALMDSGHHLVYQVLYLLGLPARVQAFTSTLARKNMECEDTALVNLGYADGSVCSVMQSWASGHDEGISGIRIVGVQGSLVISDALYFNGQKADGDVDYASSFANQARAFVDAVRGGPPPVSTLDDVRDTLRVIYAAYESADQGKIAVL